MQPSVYLFDLDGTLLDTLGDLAQSTNHVRASYGLAAWTREEVRAAIGLGLPHLLRCALADSTSEWSDALLSESLERFRVHYLANLVVETRPYPGVVEVLDELRARGAQLGVVSNKSVLYCTQLIEHFFPGRMDVVLGGDSVREKKPAPDMLLEAARRLGRQISECVMVGDSPADLEAAAHAGCASRIAVTWGFRDPSLLRQGADRLIERMGELLTLQE